MPLAAILDVDGTLVDTNYHHAIAWYRAFRKEGIVLPLWRIHRHIGMGGDQVVTALAGEGVEEEQGDDVRAAEKDLYLALIGEVEPFEGARELEVSPLGPGESPAGQDAGGGAAAQDGGIVPAAAAEPVAPADAPQPSAGGSATGQSEASAGRVAEFEARQEPTGGTLRRRDLAGAPPRERRSRQRPHDGARRPVRERSARTRPRAVGTPPPPTAERPPLGTPPPPEGEQRPPRRAGAEEEPLPDHEPPPPPGE